MLDGKRVGLETIDANCKDLILVKNDAAMLLAARDLKTPRMSEVDQLAVLLQVYHDIFLVQTGHTI